MDLLYSPRSLARAVAPWLALILLVIGAGSIAFDRLALRPEIIRFANEGRPVVGRVGKSSVSDPWPGERGKTANRSLVAVEDPELGMQLLSIYGSLPVGTIVPALCLTPARRCISKQEVDEGMSLSPLMLSGLIELALAALLFLAAWRRRARHHAAAPVFVA